MKKLQKLDIGLIAVIFIIGISIVFLARASFLNNGSLWVSGWTKMDGQLMVNSDSKDDAFPSTDTGFFVKSGKSVFNGNVGIGEDPGTNKFQIKNSSGGSIFSIDANGNVKIGNVLSICENNHCSYIKKNTVDDGYGDSAGQWASYINGYWCGVPYNQNVGYGSGVTLCSSCVPFTSGTCWQIQTDGENTANGQCRKFTCTSGGTYKFEFTSDVWH